MELDQKILDDVALRAVFSCGIGKQAVRAIIEDYMESLQEIEAAKAEQAPCGDVEQEEITRLRTAMLSAADALHSALNIHREDAIRPAESAPIRGWWQEFTRFEAIDQNGRQIVYYGKATMEIQDEGRTLKVFLATPLSTTRPEPISPSAGDVDDLITQLRVKAAMIRIGEKIAWGSDSDLMCKAADTIAAMQSSPEPKAVDDVLTRRKAEKAASVGHEASKLPPRNSGTPKG